MRRSAAAIAALVLSAATVVGPSTPASAQPIDDVERLACGTLGPPVCDLVNALQGVLEPLQPVLDLAQPLLGQLGGVLNQLGSLTGGASTASPDQMASIAQDALDQLRSAGAPLLGLLGGTDALAPLTSVLEQLVAAVDDLPGAASGQSSTSPSPADTAAPAAPVTPAPAATASGTTSATVFGATLSPQGDGAAPSSGASNSSGSDVPQVPVGDELALAPLATPHFAYPAGPGTDEVAAEVAEGAVEEALPATNAAALSAVPDSSGAMTAAGVLSVLLVVSGVVLGEVRKRRAASASS